MNGSGNNTINVTLDELSLHPAQRALKIIWVIGVCCSAVIIFFFFKPYPSSSSTLSYTIDENQEGQKYLNSIDQLLLSSDEAMLADKKSFVNGALRFQWRNQEPDLNDGNNRIILYDNMLKKKLQKIPKTENEDFSVKPVPR